MKLISFYIAWIIAYPLILLVAMWNGVGKYIDGCMETDEWFPNYRKGLRTGWKEFKRIHVVVHNYTKPNK